LTRRLNGAWEARQKCAKHAFLLSGRKGKPNDLLHTVRHWTGIFKCAFYFGHIFAKDEIDRL
jgi:hypothetical protein